MNRIGSSHNCWVDYSESFIRNRELHKTTGRNSEIQRDESPRENAGIRTVLLSVLACQPFRPTCQEPCCFAMGDRGLDPLPSCRRGCSCRSPVGSKKDDDGDFWGRIVSNNSSNVNSFQRASFVFYDAGIGWDIGTGTTKIITKHVCDGGR